MKNKNAKGESKKCNFVMFAYRKINGSKGFIYKQLAILTFG